MKTMTIILFVLASLVGAPEQNETNLLNDKDYEQGWVDGYCEGWRDVKGELAICPIAPITPISKIECASGYKCGYNRGFKSGMKKAKE
jgi:hypothetical protein